jgi:hypothetical protein
VITCPDHRCDGSGFVFDDATRTARDCSCRPQRIASARRGRSRRSSRAGTGASPSTGRGHPDRPQRGRRGAPLRRPAPRHLADGRGIWFQGDVGTGKTTLAMLISAARPARRALRGPSTRCPGCSAPLARDLRRRLGGLPVGAPRGADRGRAPPHRRRRRRRRRAPGCSSSSTRSSTRATRTAARSADHHLDTRRSASRSASARCRGLVEMWRLPAPAVRLGPAMGGRPRARRPEAPARGPCGTASRAPPPGGAPPRRRLPARMRES